MNYFSGLKLLKMAESLVKNKTMTPPEPKKPMSESDISYCSACQCMTHGEATCLKCGAGKVKP